MRKLCFILLPLVLFACTDTQPVAPDIEVAPSFKATVTNEIVYLHPWRVTWMDNEELVLLLGYDPDDDAYCNGGEFVGGIPVRRHLAVSQEGFPDEFSQRDQIVLTTIGRPPLYLYLFADFPPPDATDDDWCMFITEGWIAAGGWSATLWTDNDISGFDGTPGVNSWGGTETGVLWGRDRDKYKYSWKYRVLSSPEIGDVWKHSVDEVRRIK